MYRVRIKLCDSAIFQVSRTRQLNKILSVPSSSPFTQYAPLDQQTAGPSGGSGGSKRKSGGGFGKTIFLSALGVTVITGATVAYAKSDPDFRAWLKKNQPWAEDVISIFDFEKHIDNDWIKPIISVPSKIASILPEKRQISEGPIAPITKPSQEKSAPGKPDPIEPKKEQKVSTSASPPSKGSTAPLPPIDLPASIKEVPTIKEVPASTNTNLKTLHNEDAHQSVVLAVQAFQEATHSLKKHNDRLYQIIDSAVDSLDRGVWDKVKDLSHQKNANYQLAKEQAAKAKTHIDTMEKQLQSGEYTPESIRTWKKRISEWKMDLKDAETRYNQTKETGSVTEKYWSQVEKARENFAHELQSLFPNLDIHSKKLNIAPGSDPATELDIMLLHILKVVTHLQKELAASQTVRKNNLDNAVSKATDQDLINARVAEEVEREKRDLTLDFQKKILTYRIELENELRRQLKLQVEAHREHLNDALVERENQVRTSVEKSLSDKIDTERQNYKLQLATMVGKLKGVDDALKVRAETDKLARQSVALWTAGEAVLKALRRTPSIRTVEDLMLTSLKSELGAIQSAAVDSDELIKSVLAAIPNEVKQYGVYSECALKERFSKVEKLCRRVALVPEEGASLPIYILSWLQSFLLFSNIDAIPQSELEDKPTDFSKLDTNDILQRARYCVEHGDIRGAVQYMSLISGAAKQVSSGWIQAARDHLATRQAAEVVMAHATAAGMLYL